MGTFTSFPRKSDINYVKGEISYSQWENIVGRMGGSERMFRINNAEAYLREYESYAPRYGEYEISNTFKSYSDNSDEKKSDSKGEKSVANLVAYFYQR